MSGIISSSTTKEPVANGGGNLTYHSGISRSSRAEILSSSGSSNLGSQSGFTIWLTGLSASGKSTVGAALEIELLKLGIHAYRLDGDNVRLGLNKNLSFSPEDRSENIRRISEVISPHLTRLITLRLNHCHAIR